MTTHMARCPFKRENKHLLAMEVCERTAPRCMQTGSLCVLTEDKVARVETGSDGCMDT